MTPLVTTNKTYVNCTQNHTIANANFINQMVKHVRYLTCRLFDNSIKISEK